MDQSVRSKSTKTPAPEQIGYPPIVLFTSPCGVGTRAFFDRLGRTGQGFQVRYLDDEILKELSASDWYGAHAKSATAIRSAWARAFRSLSTAETPLLVHSHLIHYNDDLQLFFPVSDPRPALEMKNVRAVISLCDDVYETLTAARYSGLYGLIEDPADLKERRERYVDAIDSVLLWRRLDLISAEGFSRALGVKHYFVAVRHSAVNIMNLVNALLNGTEPKTYYLSHHIREVCNSGTDWQGHAELINRVAPSLVPSGVTVFEPTTIDEFVVTYDAKCRPRWPRPEGEGNFKYRDSLDDCLTSLNLSQDELAGDLSRSMRQIDRDVTWRDLRLVYQSQGFLMWRPFWRGKVSSGAMRELQVFAQREDGGRAVLVHQVGDVEQWARTTLEQLVKRCGGLEKSPGLDAAVAKLTSGMQNGGPNWAELATSIASGISANTTRRATLTSGGTRAGHNLPQKKSEIAQEVVNLLQGSNEVFSSLALLAAGARLTQEVEPNLDDPAAIDAFLASKLSSVI